MATKTRTRKALRPAVIADYRAAIQEDPQGEYAVMAREDLLKHGHDISDLPQYDPTKPIVSYGPGETGNRPVVAVYQPGETIPTLTVEDVARTTPKGQGGDTRTSRTQPPATDGQLRFIASLLADKDTQGVKDGVNVPHVQLDQYAKGTLSKRGASELIDWLKTRPAKSTEQGGRKATEKQVAALVREGARRKFASETVRQIVAKASAGQDVAFAEASAALDVLFDSPFLPRGQERPAKPTAKADSEVVVEDGMYARTETVDGVEQRVFYKVQIAHHGSGNLYAKRLVVLQEAVRDESGAIVEPGEVEFRYEAGAIRKLTPADKLGIEEAQAFGKLYGVCCACGRILTKEKSIEEGIGPICKNKL